jgi:hypothetical protein
VSGEGQPRSSGAGARDDRGDFRTAIRRAPGVDAGAWTPRELRHSFVSPLSDSGSRGNTAMLDAVTPYATLGLSLDSLGWIMMRGNQYDLVRRIA